MQILKSEFFHIQKRDKIACFLIVFLSLVYLFRLNSGIISVEPDEANHVEVVRSLRNSFYPSYFGTPFYFSYPMYPFVSLILSSIIQDPFLSLRVVSVLSTLLCSLVIFFYLRFYFGYLSGLFGSVAYLLIPVTVFYGRLGLIEPTLSLLILCFIISFDFYTKTRSHISWVLSVLFLSLSLLSKFTSLILFFLPLGYLLFKFLLGLKNSRGAIWKTLKEVDKKLVLLIVMPLLILIAVTLTYYLHDPINLKAQLKYILGYGPKASNLNQLLGTLAKYPRFFSIQILILSFLGIMAVFFSKKIQLVVFFYTFLLYVITSNPLSTNSIRYFASLTACLGIFSGLGFWWLSKNLGKFGLVLAIMVLISVLPLTSKSFWGSVHPSIKQTATYLKENYNDRFVFHNYWPTTFVVYNQNYKQTWLSDNYYDTNAFAHLPNSKFTALDIDSKKYLNKEGGVVVIQQPFFNHSSEDFGREKLAKLTMERGKKLAEFDDNPNFYPFPERSERYGIYQVSPGVFDD